MTIQWIENICNKGGLDANTRKLFRKLADEVYRLHQSMEPVDVPVVIETPAIEEEPEEEEPTKKMKRGRPRKDN